MNFREILSQASYNGIRFEVEISEANDTSTYIIHKFPGNRKKPIPEFVGDDPLVMPITSFLLGEARYRTWELLRSAKKNGKAGRLIHPSLGLKTCYLSSIKAIENNKKIGRLKVLLEFIEAESEQTGLVDEVNSFICDAKESLIRIQAEFVQAFSIVDLPAYALAQTSQLVGYCRQFVKSANGLGRIPKAIDNFAISLRSLGGELEGLVKSPGDLAKDLSKTIGRIESDALAQFNLFELPKNTQEPRVAGNSTALKTFVISSLVSNTLIKAADCEKKLDPESMNSLYSLLKAQLPHDVNFELRTLLARYGVLFKRKEEGEKVTVHEPKPCVLLSYELYGKLDHEFKGKHPLFVEGEVFIEKS